MSLARAWRRKLYGAGTVALLVPGAIVGALTALALAGGFGRLGTLGQVFSGPAIPSTSGVAARLASHGAASAIAAGLAASAPPIAVAPVAAGRIGSGTTVAAVPGGSGTRGGSVGSPGPGGQGATGGRSGSGGAGVTGG
jgi:hypothetical protein